MANHGRGSVADPFGGSYYGGHYERAGLVGAIELLRAARTLQRTAWDDVHASRLRLTSAEQPQEADHYTRWWSVDCGARDDMEHGTHRGAAWRATHYGGRVHAQRCVRQDRIEARRQRVISETQSAVHTAIKVHALLEYLAEVGLTEYEPSQEICGIHDRKINLTGIRWLAGHKYEQGSGVPLDDALDIAALVRK
jgi:hypothetical protein